MYDAVHARRDDIGFWEAMASSAAGGPVVELGCGTGRILIPLARAGREIVGIDQSEQMLALCRRKLAGEPAEVRGRVHVLQADMTSFDVARRFSLVAIPFASFQHLLTVKQQLACLDRCRAHLAPRGSLVLDLPNPSPEPLASVREEPLTGAAGVEVVAWTDGRQVRWWADVTESRPSQQLYTFAVTYEVVAADGATHRVSETLRLRYVFRYELEHLLARAGFRVAALYGDYDLTPYADDSPAMIVVARLR